MSEDEELGRPDETRAELTRMLAALRRRWWLPTLLGLLAAAAALGSALSRPPTWLVSGLVELGMRDDSLQRRSRDGSLFQTHRQLLTSYPVLDAALRRAGVAEADLKREREALLGQIYVEPVQDTFLVRVLGQGPDPKALVLRVNSLLEAFVEFTDEFLDESARSQRRLEEREQSLMASQEQQRARQQALAREAGLDPLQERDLRLRDQDLRARATALELERLGVQSEVERLRAWGQAPSGDLPPSASGAAQDPEESQLRARLAAMRASIREERLARLPEYQSLREQLALRQRGLAERRLAELVARDALLQASQQKVAALRARLEPDLATLDRLDRQRATLEREQAWCQAQLEGVRGELLLARGAGAGGKIVQRAERPPAPEPRVKPLMPALLFALGAMAGAVLVVLWDRLEGTLRTEEDARALGLPILGGVPRLALQELDELAHLRGSSWAAEAFGLIRANLGALARTAPERALLITSGGPGDGKTLVAANLAVSFARSGARTLLVDADLRCPRASGLLDAGAAEGARPSPGLREVLERQASLADACRPTEFERLDLLPSGEPPRNPADLLQRADFAALVRAALEVYDRVVVDAPPARPFADASLFTPAVQGVIHVVRLGHSRRRLAAAAIEQLRAVGARDLGLVLTEAPPWSATLGAIGDGPYEVRDAAAAPLRPGSPVFVLTRRG
ncbi:MAG: polysaccharide biosynthesis tyrosine autokinase [Planctomycetota bacterium]